MSQSHPLAPTTALPKRDRSQPAVPAIAHNNDTNMSQAHASYPNSHFSPVLRQTQSAQSSFMPKIRTPDLSPIVTPPQSVSAARTQPITASVVLQGTKTQISAQQTTPPSNGQHAQSVSVRLDQPATAPSTTATTATTAAAVNAANAEASDIATPTAAEPSSDARVLAHQDAMLETLRELVRARNVGHWKGLDTEQRKEVAKLLCQEHLFNPQPGRGKDSRTVVQWTIQSSWTDYDIWVVCVKRVEPFYQGRVYLTEYKVHFDQSGKLAQFDEKRSEQQKNCVVM